MKNFSTGSLGNYPLVRMRRNRMKKFSRDIISENFINIKNLIYPLFVTDHEKEDSFISSMPGVKRHSLKSLVKEALDAHKLGIPAIAIFPYIDPNLKDESGSLSYDKNNIVCKAIDSVKQKCPEIGVICDVALDPFTSHGHDGIIKNGSIDNDLTIEVLCKQSIVQSEAGCDIIAPSDMMDGRVLAIRKSLDQINHKNTQIMAYSAKYASSFYSPFRNAIGSNQQNLLIEKNTYQINPCNSNEAMKEIKLDIQEGADMILIKPALPYLDIIHKASKTFDTPMFAYQVSGEYSLIKNAAQNGIIDEKKAMIESLISIKRAGAIGIITYFAKNMAKYLKENL
tara:strand:+ start:1469 stop:2488 length:1020 start_codon:yes stop_codon:yes gene_type:complete